MGDITIMEMIKEKRQTVVIQVNNMLLRLNNTHKRAHIETGLGTRCSQFKRDNLLSFDTGLGSRVLVRNKKFPVDTDPK